MATYDERPRNARVLNASAQGVVYERDGTAVKIPWSHYRGGQGFDHDDDLEIIDREKEVYRRLGQHCCILQVLDLDRVGLHMVLMENGSLHDYLLAQNQPRPHQLLQLWWWLLDIARALVHVHERRVIVADIATRNVLLAADLAAKLADFGESTIMPIESGMPLADEYGYSIFTDIGQFGKVMYEIVYGQRCSFDLYHDQDQITTPGPAIAAWPPRTSLPGTSDVWLGHIIEACWIQGALRDTAE